MNTYECMLLLDNREVREGWQALKDRATGMLTKHGAEILSARRWEERRLAYPINHQQRGTYLLVYMKSDPGAISLMRREMSLSTSVMRNLILTCDAVPEEAFAPEEEFDETQVQVEDVYQPPPPPAASKEAAADEGEGEGKSGEPQEAGAGEGEKADAGEAEQAEAGEGEKAEEKKEEGGEPVAAAEPAAEAADTDAPKDSKE